jgi:hypothetical protein
MGVVDARIKHPRTLFGLFRMYDITKVRKVVEQEFMATPLVLPSLVTGSNRGNHKGVR